MLFYFIVHVSYHSYTSIWQLYILHPILKQIYCVDIYPSTCNFLHWYNVAPLCTYIWVYRICFSLPAENKNNHRRSNISKLILFIHSMCFVSLLRLHRSCNVLSCARAIYFFCHTLFRVRHRGISRRVDILCDPKKRKKKHRSRSESDTFYFIDMFLPRPTPPTTISNNCFSKLYLCNRKFDFLMLWNVENCNCGWNKGHNI